MINNLTFKKIIAYDSDDYEQALTLRNNILRKPLGLDLMNEDLSCEKDAYHLGLFKGTTLAAVLVLIPLDNNTLKMRQVAVDEALQGKHLGQKLITFAESFAKTQGYQKIILNARKYAEVFYHKQQYQRVSEPFIELGIPHIKMEKRLNN